MPKAAASAQTSIARSLAQVDRHIRGGRWSEAVEACRQALRVNPACAPVLYRLGVIASRRGDLLAAIDLVRAAAEADGGDALYLGELCEMCRLAGRLDEALDAGQRAVALSAPSAQSFNNLGIVHYERGEFAIAADHYRSALALAPALAQAHSNLGNALRALHLFDEAVGAYAKAVEIEPGFADAWSNLGSSLNVLGRRDEALDAYRKSVASDPLNGNGHTGLAMQLLQRGDFAQGWYEYEWRWRSSDLAGKACAGPRWMGEDLAGRRVLLHAEQGLGDTIQFCRYARQLARGGAEVTLSAPRRLVRLLSASFGGVTIIGDDEPAAPHGLQCPLLSLPLLLGAREDTIPAEIPYLRAPISEVAKWRTRLSGLAGLKVGIAWAGNPRHMNDHNRSITPAEFAALFAVEGIGWVSLQVGPPAAQSGADDPPQRIDAASDIEDFLDTAGAMSCLDLVICIDSAVAHLAGALGLPTWVLLPVGSDWRWLLERGESPWYPTVRLFRQQTYGAWAPVLAQVAGALRSLFRIEA